MPGASGGWPGMRLGCEKAESTEQEIFFKLYMS